MSPIIAMIEGRNGGACEESGGEVWPFFFQGAVECWSGAWPCWLSCVRRVGRLGRAWWGRGPGNCVIPLNSLFQIVGFFGALSGGGAGRGEGG